MERKKSRHSGEGSSPHRARKVEGQEEAGGVLAWWYRHFAPLEPPADASFAQREKVRRGRIASIVMPIFILFLLGLLLVVLMEQNYRQASSIGLGIVGSILVLWLNRRGWLRSAGLLVLLIVYAGEIFSLAFEARGLTASNIFLLDFSVLPDVMVLAFFSANSLFPVVGLNVLLTWGLVTFGLHDAAIADMLRYAPLELFAHVYLLQLVLASTLYLWARSSEVALQRADRAEEIVALERRENERKQEELAQKAQLDNGIQQILQTLIAAANGDLSARAPLNQEHVLWQVAMSLNNLIARLQSSSHAESELRQQIWEGNERSERVTGAQRALSGEITRVTEAQRALSPGGKTAMTSRAQYAGPETAKVPGVQPSRPGIADQQPRSGRAGEVRPERGGTGSRLKALRLEQEDRARQEKAARPEHGHTIEAQESVYPGADDTKEL